ncbi:MAG TPA: hypothetical protein VGI99_06570 [Gemmataceae bacterium]
MTDVNSQSDSATPGPGTARAVVLFALVGLFAYFNSLHGAFLLDDDRFARDENIGKPFKSEMAARPVISLSLAIDYWIDGRNPRGYHAMNIAVHILAGLFLYDLICRTLLAPRFGGQFDRWAGWIGLSAGLIWLVHPLNTQAVTYVIQRCESFMGMFFLASLWCYVRGAWSSRGRWWFLAAAICCAFGAGCKELMIALPPLALLYDRTFITGSWRESLRRRWLILGLLAVPPIAGLLALALTGFFTDSAGTVGFGVKIYTPYTYALTQTEVILHYLRLAFVPTGLTLDYLDWKPCTSLRDCWLSTSIVLGLLAITALGVLFRTAWSFPAAWFFVILAPSSSIVPVQDAAFEHRMYLPLAGVVALFAGTIAWAALRWRPASGRSLGIGAGIAIFALGLLTAARNEDYSSPQRLFADNAAKRPANGRVRLNLAVQLFGAGDVAGAEEQLAEAFRLPLRLPSLRGEQVKVLREAGRSADAVAEARKMHQEQPDSIAAAYELGLSLLVDGQAAEAAPLLKRAAEESPGNKFYRLHNGIALLATGRETDADAEFRSTAAMDPKYAALLNQTSRRIANDPEAKKSNLRLAAWYAAASCRMSDDPSAEFRDTHALTLARVGRFPEAATEATRAAEQARRDGDNYRAERIEARAALFRAGKSFLPE